MQICKLPHDLKARTLFPWIEVPMPHDHRPGKPGMHLLDELSQGPDLLRRPGVRGLTRVIEAPLIADAYGVSVMPHDMGTHL